MVSVDPQRDSPRALQRFFQRIGVQAIGLTGSPIALAPVYRAYGVAVQPQRGDIAHSDYVYVLDGQGRMLEILEPATPLNAVAHDFRAVVE